ncbi:MAG: fumarylacetoacetate hydrolase family protein [Rhizobiaceae bacterium]|nr:fumarylacetoacetate hydrolase family protein [Rhizobiaceae bacterium]
MSDQQSVAARITRDLLDGAAFEAYRTEPPRSVEAAYELQDAVSVLLAGVRGRVAGWKIAANSPALLERFGLKEPVSGRIFANQIYEGPAVLKVADYAQFAFEPEIAAVIGRTLTSRDAPFGADQVADAIARFVPSLELLDMRMTDMKAVHIPDAVAQNISNAGAVRGGPGAAPGEFDVADVRTVLSINGEVVYDVTGAAPQSPVEAVTWLANHLSARGLSLEAGQIVTCGTHSPIWYHEGAGEIRVEMSGLGSVSLTLE